MENSNQQGKVQKNEDVGNISNFQSSPQQEGENLKNGPISGTVMWKTTLNNGEEYMGVSAGISWKVRLNNDEAFRGASAGVSWKTRLNNSEEYMGVSAGVSWKARLNNEESE
ncbi:hypothetical protein OCA28_25150 [Bacillus cereus]|nr:hypothetical protein [Bacillus cereus]